MSYVDGFVLCVPKKKLGAYKKLADLAGKVWKKYGALAYLECVLDDPALKCGRPFTKLARPKPGETVLFSYIVYKSRSHRDAVNKKVMADTRMRTFMNDPMPFDVERMSYGGFKAFVER